MKVKLRYIRFTNKLCPIYQVNSSLQHFLHVLQLLITRTEGDMYNTMFFVFISVLLFFLLNCILSLPKSFLFFFSQPIFIQFLRAQKCLAGLIRPLSDVNMLALELSLEKTSKILSVFLFPLQVLVYMISNTKYGGRINLFWKRQQMEKPSCIKKKMFVILSQNLWMMLGW